MIINENDPRSTQAWRKRLAAMAVPDPKPPSRKPLPANPSTIAAIRQLSLAERRQFMEASDFLRPDADSSDLVAGLDHFERIVAKPVADCLWRCANEVDPNVNRGTRAHMARSQGRRFDVITRAATATLPASTASAGSPGLLTELQGKAVPYDSWSIVGHYEERHQYGSLDGSIGPGTASLPLMFDHGRTDPWPIGRSLSWDSQPAGLSGLWALDDSPNAQRAARLAGSGELGYLSIAFVPVRSEWQMHDHWDPLVGNLDRCTRVESRLVEVSVVSCPAFADAQVTAVRNASAQQRSQQTITEMYPESVVAWKIEVAALRQQHRQAVTVAPAELTTKSTLGEVIEYARWLNSRISTLEGLGGNVIAPLTPDRPGGGVPAPSTPLLPLPLMP